MYTIHVTDLEGRPRLPRPEVEVIIMPGTEDLQDVVSLLDVALTQGAACGTHRSIGLSEHSCKHRIQQRRGVLLLASWPDVVTAAAIDGLLSTTKHCLARLKA